MPPLHAGFGVHGVTVSRSGGVPVKRAGLALVSSPESDVVHTVEQLIAEGQAAEKVGNRTEARRCFERALYRIRDSTDGARASTILRWIARTYLGDVQMDAALDCLAAAVAVAEQWGDEAAAGSALNVEAVIRWQLGEIDEAERLYLVARSYALRAGDAKLAAMTAQNLGVIANVRGDTDEAQRHYEASLGEYRALGLAKDVSVALNNLGLLHTQMERWGDAERSFNEAVQISDAIGDLSARMQLDVNLAEMWVTRQDFAKAQQSVRHALDLSTRTGDATAVGRASKLLGVIARETGDPAEAEAQFGRAEEIAAARGDVLLAAEVARESGELARRQGRNSLVLQHLNRSHRLFTQLRARRDLADIGKRTGRLEDEFLQVARRWGESIEAKDRYTQGHCVRVSDLACTIAADMGFADQDLFWFRIGALLHDVGKLVIPEEVLNKPGKLTDEEWTLMRSHTTAGVEMLSGIDFPWDVMPIVRSHHERWDGKGYPDRLAGEDIPLVARILCIADVYDALTSVRSYKMAMTHAQAVEIMHRDIGTMFDPLAFAAFERISGSWVQRETRQLVDDSAPAAAAPPHQTASDNTSAPIWELDDLTQMPLRRAIRMTTERVLEARQTTGRPVSLLVIDVDHFKLVNDTFGHLQGDDVLRAVADVVRAQTRPSDFIARYAGDEFVVLLPGTGLEQAMEIAERLRDHVARAQCARRDGAAEPVRVTLSIGAATAPAQGETLDALFAAADGALYSAKRRGRNAVGSASGAGALRDATLLLDTFIGRASERQRITRLLDLAARGTPQVLSVVGEAGVGKSTLLRQLTPEMGVRAGSLIVGRCLDSNVRPPYGPWVEVIKAIHHMGLVPHREWRELGRLVPALGAGSATADTVAGSTSARFPLFQEIEEYITAATQARPLVIILDDMQWADGETWDVLDLMVPRLSGQRLLLALTVRNEDLTEDGKHRCRSMSRHECFSEMELGRLSQVEIEHWLRVALSGQAPESALIEYMVAHTEGNPLFALQTLRMMSEDGVVRHEDGQWRYFPSPETTLPTAVRDLLSRRLGRLSEPTREILTAAAVFGSQFDADLLIGASPLGEDVVFDALDEGVRAGVLAARENDGPAAFEFTHGLLADVLRRSGNPLRLRRVHERVARVLERQPHADPALIAAHFDRGGNRDDAHRYALIAGERAMKVYAYDAASSCFEMASRHARALAEHANAQWRLATLDEMVGRYGEAEQRCALLLSTYAAGVGELALTSGVKRMRERLRLLRGAPASDVLTDSEALLTDARRAGDRQETVALLLMISQVQARLGDSVVAERVAREAIAEASLTDDPSLNADAIMRLGSTLLVATPADAVTYYRQALDIFRHLEDRRGQLRCHINIGVACDRAGNHHAAELSYATALDLGREIKAADLTALASMNLGVLLSKTGRFAEARHRLDEALRIYASVNNEPLRLSALYNVAHLARERGDAAGATELYAATVSLAQQLGQLDVHVGALCGMGLADLVLGHFASAVARLNESVSLLAGRESHWFQGRELLEALHVRVLTGRGDRRSARQRLFAGLRAAEQHDQYAAVWLAAQCVGGLPDLGDDWREMVRKHAVQARALGYAPLVAQLAAAAFVDDAATTGASEIIAA
ncbi:diguanylate cyclase [Gemmatimonas sp.]|uniref:diguanylate cyclase n=1 Tax=Gemmatimonas sp. TaxID=1962908 RepID=UPI0039833E34